MKNQSNLQLFDSQSGISLYNAQYLNTKELESQTDKWVHLTCAVAEAKLQTKLPHYKCDNISELFKFKEKECSCCKTKEGVLIKCIYPDCEEYFHAECARRVQLQFKENINLEKSDKEKIMNTILSKF